MKKQNAALNPCPSSSGFVVCKLLLNDVGNALDPDAMSCHAVEYFESIRGDVKVVDRVRIVMSGC